MSPLPQLLLVRIAEVARERREAFGLVISERTKEPALWYNRATGMMEQSRAYIDFKYLELQAKEEDLGEGAYCSGVDAGMCRYGIRLHNIGIRYDLMVPVSDVLPAAALSA